MRTLWLVRALPAVLLCTLAAVGARRAAVPPRPTSPRISRSAADDPAPAIVFGSFDERGPTIRLPHAPRTGSLTVRSDTLNGRSVPAAAPRREGDRTVYDRGVAREVYIDRPDGLEQTFEFDEPVTEIGISGRFETEWEPTRREGRGIVFSGPTGEVLAYGEARVLDADGRTAPVRMTLDGRCWTLDVDRGFLADARFPVVVDPLIEPISKAAASKTSEALADAESFDLDDNLVAILRAAVSAGTETDDFTLLWPTPKGPMKMTGLLARQFSKDAKIVVHAEDRDEVVVAPNDLVFVASADNADGKVQVAAHVTLEGVQSHLQMGDTRYAQEMDFATMRGLSVIQRLVETPTEFRCGTSSAFGTSVRGLSTAVPVSKLAPVEAKIALVLDYDLYRGTRASLGHDDPSQIRRTERDAVSSAFRRVYGLFRDELGIFLRLSHLVLYARPDPYNADVYTFQRSYDAVEGTGVERVAAMLITGREEVEVDGESYAGYAVQIGSAGDRANAYAIARHYLDWGQGSAMVWAHELGHVFGSPHTNLYKPPVEEDSLMTSGDYEHFTFSSRVADGIRSFLTQIFTEQCAGRRRLEGLAAFFTRPLTPGGILSNCSAGASGEPYGCELEIPQGTTFLRIRASGGQGSYELAACRHLSAVPSAYEDQAATLYDRQEVHVANPAPGRWFVSLSSPTGAVFSGVTLSATLNDPPRLANAQSEFVRDLKPGMDLYYRIDVPPGGRDLLVSTHGPVLTGFFRLALDRNLSALANWPQIPPVAGLFTALRMTGIPGASEGVWYARLNAAADVGFIDLEALHAPTLTTSSSSESLGGLSAPHNTLGRHFRIVRPPGIYNRLVITASGGRHQGFDVLVTVDNPWYDEFHADWGRNPFRNGRVPVGGFLTLTIDNPQLNEYFVQFVGTTGSERQDYPPYFDMVLRATWSRR